MCSSDLWAVLPVKNVKNAKQRLAPVLQPPERRRLFQAMVEDVLEALASSPGLAGVVMVTRDAAAKRLAKLHNARVLVEKANTGHTEASMFGASTLAAEGATGMIQVPGDLPNLTPDDIQSMLDAHGDAPAVTIAPSRDKRGSNAVACSPPDLLPLRFGDDSFSPHLARARDLGVEPAIVKRPGLGLDIDTPDDLRAFLAAPSPTRTLAYLTESGIAERLRED